MAAKKQSYEENIEEIDKILEKLENQELSLDESIAEYEKAIKAWNGRGRINAKGIFDWKKRNSRKKSRK